MNVQEGQTFAVLAELDRCIVTDPLAAAALRVKRDWNGTISFFLFRDQRSE